jgi:hypothetical protein
MATFKSGNGLSVRAQKSDAMTLLAFGLAESRNRNWFLRYYDANDLHFLRTHPDDFRIDASEPLPD